MDLGRRPAAVLGALCLTGAAALAGLTPAGAASAASAAASAAVPELGGQQVPGGAGSTDANAPTVLTAGLWADELGGTPSTNLHYFRYTRQIQGSAVHVSAVGLPQSLESDGIKVESSVVVDGADTSCESEEKSSAYAVPNAPLGVGITVDGGRVDATDAPCLDTAQIEIQVSRGYASNTSKMPIAIKVVEEAPVSGADALTEPGDKVTYVVRAGKDGDEEPGGSGFDDAPLLDAADGGLTVKTTITEGERQFWRVPVQWGQQVIANATTLAADDATVEALGCCGGVGLRLQIFDPMRDGFAVAADGAETEDTGSYGQEPGDLVAGMAPLRYLNRYDDEPGDLPGDYWVVLTAAPVPADKEREPVSFEAGVTIAVAGSPTGQPAYQAAVLAPGGAAGPSGYSAEKPYLTGDSSFAAVASGNPASSKDDADGWFGVRHGAGLVVGLLSIACLAVGGLRLRSRRA